MATAQLLLLLLAFILAVIAGCPLSTGRFGLGWFAVAAIALALAWPALIAALGT